MPFSPGAVGDRRHLGRTLLFLLALSASATRALSPPAAGAQEILFLELRGPGSAIVAFDESTRAAYITDGGKSGRRGIAGAQVEGRHVLDTLLRRGTERLTIICSHPHSDHIDGLLDLVCDRRMGSTQLRELHFVDSESRAESRLYKAYTDRWPEEKTRGRASYRSARGADVLAPLAEPGARVVASNFVYDPPPAGADPHARCVITTFELHFGDETSRVVDFDDAEDDLVRQWAEWVKGDPAARRPTGIVPPHHGSAYSDIAPLLDESIRPRWAVIAVNPDNQYHHPDPDTLLELAESLGVDNVHFTGGSGNVLVDERGITSRHDPARLPLDYELFLKKSTLDIEERLVKFEGRPDLAPATDRGLARLRQRRDACRELKAKMTAAAPHDPSQPPEGPDGIPTRPAADAPVFPGLAQAEDEARGHLKLEDESSSWMRSIRDELEGGRIDGAARLARDGLEREGRWSARERRALEQVVALHLLLAGREAGIGPPGPGPVADPRALLWPEIAGETGADALRRRALREAREILASPDVAAAGRIRWVVEALERSGGDRDPAGVELVGELRYLLLLEGAVDETDIRAVGRLSPEQAAAQLRMYKEALAGGAIPGGPGRDHPRLPAPPAPGRGRLSPRIADGLIPAIDAQLSEGAASPGKIETRRAAGAVLDEVDAVMDLRDAEVRIRTGAVEHAERALGGPLLDCEAMALRGRIAAGARLADAIDELHASREGLLEIARDLNLEPARPIPWRELPYLKRGDIGIDATKAAQALSGRVDDLSKLKFLTELKARPKWLRP